MRNRTNSSGARARQLRQDLSPPEAILWKNLKGDALGVRVRRQHPFGPFVLDFFVPCVSLCIEVDGGQAHEGRRERDDNREAYCREHGVDTIRFSAADVSRDPKAVVEAIFIEIEARKTPSVPANRDTSPCKHGEEAETSD